MRHGVGTVQYVWGAVRVRLRYGWVLGELWLCGTGAGAGRNVIGNADSPPPAIGYRCSAGGV